MKELNNLQPLLKDFVANGPAGCAMTVTYQGENVFEDYIGLADMESENEISPDNIYRIYSMTKVVTCVAALILYERGLYLLNEPLEKYLPEFKNPQVYRTDEKGDVYTSPSSRSIHIKDLFTMSSGLTYEGDGDETERHVQKELASISDQQENLQLRDLSKILASIPLAFDPGTQWRYGFSHDVLAAFIEVVSGKKLGAFLKDEIFDPLHMNDTSFRLTEEKKHRLCTLYTLDESGDMMKETNLDRHFHPKSLFESGGAGLLSTIRDYSRFAQVLANGGELDGVRLLGKKTIQLMATNHLEPEQLTYFNWPYLVGYGYGLGVRVLINPSLAGTNSSIGEFGWSGLAGTWVLIDPKEKLSAVYMQQMLPNFEAYHQPRLRNIIYGAL
ncbi:serine hydrolase [Salipaludibacillus neizhouensis]|uniref:Serine hydrolase n=1 Tax=Salipaludibacillus neizhouensis TaxID=885475 RepID=A0A3A9K5J8_9BACI|nr:serine hydrolase domain-containing protein [Salipaludibacillus neizhouensis]RKL67847.1 serine hydrolase [Salipaludibacillus neizhouensis]